jgi:hypothetical protein
MSLVGEKGPISLAHGDVVEMYCIDQDSSSEASDNSQVALERKIRSQWVGKRKTESVLLNPARGWPTTVEVNQERVESGPLLAFDCIRPLRPSSAAQAAGGSEEASRGVGVQDGGMLSSVIDMMLSISFQGLLQEGTAEQEGQQEGEGLLVYAMGPDAAEKLVRAEAWYSQLYSQTETCINNIHRQDAGCEVRLVGIQGDLRYGTRTLGEWTALHKDIDKNLQAGIVKVRPQWLQLGGLGELEEQVFGWVERGAARQAIICSVPSRTGDNEAVHQEVVTLCQGKGRVHLTFSSSQSGASQLFNQMATVQQQQAEANGEDEAASLFPDLSGKTSAPTASSVPSFLSMLWPPGWAVFSEDKFVTSDFKTCEPEVTARGLADFLGLAAGSLGKVQEFDETGQLAVIHNEFRQHGNDEDIRIVEYILNEDAAEVDEQVSYGVVVRDQGHNGMRLADFHRTQPSGAGLSLAHIAALRVYSSNAYKCINGPLREQEKPHPFAFTTYLVAEAVHKLRLAIPKSEQCKKKDSGAA